MRQKASGRMRSSRKGRSLCDPARARRVRKRTLFYTGDGSVSQYLRQILLPRKLGQKTVLFPIFSGWFFFPRKLDTGPSPCCLCHSSKKRKRASTDQEKEKIFAGAGRQEAEAGVYRSRKGKNLRQHRKTGSGNERLPIVERKISSPAQEGRKRKRASTDREKEKIFAGAGRQEAEAGVYRSGKGKNLRQLKIFAGAGSQKAKQGHVSAVRNFFTGNRTE